AKQSPVYDGYLAFAAHARSSASYTIQNTGQITSWGRGPTNFQNQAVADSAAAYQNALMWAVTGNRANADKARDLLNAWSADLTAIQTILAIGVFCEEPVLFEDALRFAAAGAGNGSIPHRIVTDAGQGQESGRDQGHEQLAVGLTGDIAQVAWNQGIDLWAHD